jgi:hypothetical protein
VPAITPWTDGAPAFAELNSFRTLICLTERRCTVCGIKLPRGPMYRMVDGEAADLIEMVLDAGKSYVNAAPASEGPGHRACMLYSAMLCPHLSSPGARRTTESTAGTQTLPKGDPRGPSAVVVGYDGYHWKVGERSLEIFFGQPVELLRYAEGADLADELRAEIARERGPAQSCPAYRLDDDAKAEQAARAIIAGGGGSQAGAARQQEQARKNRHKAARSARRKNR